MSKIKSLEDIKGKVSKALKKMSTEDLIVTRLEYGEGAEGFRWELYRGTIPFWVDLVRFHGKVDLLIVYSIMFGIPEHLPKDREAELYSFLLELNDFSQSWDTKLFLKDRTVVLCASRSGDEIHEQSAEYLMRSFTRFAKIISDRISEKFQDIAKFVVEDVEIPIENKDIERKES